MRDLSINPILHNNSQILQLYFNDIKSKNIIENELYEKIINGDIQAINDLVECNLKFIVSVAKQYKRPGVELEDLISEGNLGLIKAARTFDPSTGFKFISYAVWQVRSFIILYLMNHSTNVKIPNGKSKKISSIKKILSLQEQELGNQLSYALACELNPDVDPYVIQSIFSSKLETSIDTSLGYEGENFTISDLLESDESFKPDFSFERKEELEYLYSCINKLPTFDRNVLCDTYGINNHMQLLRDKIREKYDMSQKKHDRIIKTSLLFLKNTLNNKPNIVVKKTKPNIVVKKTKPNIEPVAFIKIKEKKEANIQSFDNLILDEYFGAHSGVMSNVKDISNKFNIDEINVLEIINNYKKNK